MPKFTINSHFVRAASCPAGAKKIDYFDDRQTGFVLQVRSSGRKTFYQRYRDERGREHQFRVGPADVLTLDQARRRARTVQSRAILGSDPQEERRNLRAVPTFRRLVHDRYLSHAESYKRSWKNDELLLRLHIVPELGALCLDEIGGKHITDLLRNKRLEGYTPATRNRLLTLIRTIFNLAIRWKIPGASDNPTLGIAMVPEHFRERYLTRDETHRLLESLSLDENRSAAQIILLLLLTGARRSEITKSKWENLDLDQGTLFVPISKTGKPRRLILNAEAVTILRSLRPIAGNPYLLPSQKTERPFTSLHAHWKRIRERAGLENLRVHDLRHSYASFLINQGVSLYVVQKLLGHTQPQTTQRYAHLSKQTLEDAAEAAGRFVGEARQRQA